MPTLTESKIEEFAIGLFEQLGYSYLYGPDIEARSSFEDVIFVEQLRSAVYRINPKLPKDVCDDIPGAYDLFEPGIYNWSAAR